MTKFNTRIRILNTNIDNFSMKETLSLICNTIEKGKQIHHTVVNAWKIVKMQKDKELCDSVNNADIINADGQSVIWASKILGQPLKERVAGIDLMEELIKISFDKGYKVFFFGSKEEIVLKVVEKYSNKYSRDIVAGHRNGYFDKSKEREIAQEISNSNAQILFVAISSPIKEKFLYKNKALLSRVNFVMGVGGSFDVVAGRLKRAPRWMQKLGFEWAYRFIQEPKIMWKRYLIGNIQFIKLVFQHKLNK